MGDLTVILDRLEQGDPNAADELLPLVYNELRRLAAHKMAQEAAGHTLQPTALVHEAWLRLTDDGRAATWNGRAHFFGAAAEAMRRILIERARQKSAIKRGSGWERIDLEKVDVAVGTDDETLLVVNEAIENLLREDPKAAELVKLRFFGGLTLEESGRLLGFSERTAKRCWAFARAWLYSQLKNPAT